MQTTIARVECRVPDVSTVHCKDDTVVFEVPTVIAADWAHEGGALRLDATEKRGVVYDLTLDGTVIAIDDHDRAIVSFGGLLCAGPRAMFGSVGESASLSVAAVRAQARKRPLRPRT